MKDKIRVAVEGMDANERSNFPRNLRQITAREITRRGYFVEHGLCPLCGEDSAPYYFCLHHRKVASVRRMLNKMVDRNIIARADKRGYYHKPANCTGRLEDYQWGPEMEAGDRRLLPRLGRRPVDLKETLLGIFTDEARPLSEDEIILAWGKLRAQRKTESLAGDMSKLILAERRREQRNGRRLASSV